MPSQPAAGTALPNELYIQFERDMRELAQLRARAQSGQLSAPLGAPPAAQPPTVTPQHLSMGAAAAALSEAGAGSAGMGIPGAGMGIPSEPATAPRTREESPPRDDGDDVEDITPWPTAHLQRFTSREALMQARLDSIGFTEVFGRLSIVILPWPPAEWISLAANCCRASTDMRPASARGWKDARLHGLVLTRLIVMYVMGVTMPAMEMRDLEKMRDGFIDALPWAFDVSVEGDDEWPEPQQRSEGRCEAATVARRLAWFEAVLRITFAARRDKERFTAQQFSGNRVVAGSAMRHQLMSRNSQRSLGNAYSVCCREDRWCCSVLC